MKDRIVPSSLTEVLHHPDGLKAVVYVNKEKTEAIAFRGNRKKADWHDSFPSEAVFTIRKDSFFKHVTECHDAKRAANRPHTLKKGDVVCNSWGYEQTNVDFYQVTRVTTNYVYLRSIGQELTSSKGAMSGTVVAKPGQFTSEEENRHKVSMVGDIPRVSFPHGSGTLWKGEPKYCSWYA